METIELQIDDAQKEKLISLCIEENLDERNYKLMSQILLSKAIEEA